MTAGQGAQSAYMAAAMHAIGMEPQLVPEGGRPLSEQVLQAHYAGNKEEILRLCLRAEAGLSPVPMLHLTDAQLEDRIGRIHILLARANDEKQARQRRYSARHQAERQAFLHSELARKGCSIDPSDPDPSPLSA